MDLPLDYCVKFNTKNTSLIIISVSILLFEIHMTVHCLLFTIFIISIGKLITIIVDNCVYKFYLDFFSNVFAQMKSWATCHSIIHWGILLRCCFARPISFAAICTVPTEWLRSYCTSSYQILIHNEKVFFC